MQQLIFLLTIFRSLLDVCCENASQFCANEDCTEKLFQGVLMQDNPDSGGMTWPLAKGHHVDVYAIELSDAPYFFDAMPPNQSPSAAVPLKKVYKAFLRADDYVHFLINAISSNRTLFHVIINRNNNAIVGYKHNVTSEKLQELYGEQLARLNPTTTKQAEAALPPLKVYAEENRRTESIVQPKNHLEAQAQDQLKIQSAQNSYPAPETVQKPVTQTVSEVAESNPNSYQPLTPSYQNKYDDPQNLNGFPDFNIEPAFQNAPEGLEKSGQLSDFTHLNNPQNSNIFAGTTQEPLVHSASETMNIDYQPDHHQNRQKTFAKDAVNEMGKHSDGYSAGYDRIPTPDENKSVEQAIRSLDDVHHLDELKRRQAEATMREMEERDKRIAIEEAKQWGNAQNVVDLPPPADMEASQDRSLHLGDPHNKISAQDTFQRANMENVHGHAEILLASVPPPAVNEHLGVHNPYLSDSRGSSLPNLDKTVQQVTDSHQAYTPAVNTMAQNAIYPTTIPPEGITVPYVGTVFQNVSHVHPVQRGMASTDEPIKNTVSHPVYPEANNPEEVNPSDLSNMRERITTTIHPVRTSMDSVESAITPTPNYIANPVNPSTGQSVEVNVPVSNVVEQTTTMLPAAELTTSVPPAYMSFASSDAPSENMAHLVDRTTNFPKHGQGSAFPAMTDDQPNSLAGEQQTYTVHSVISDHKQINNKEHFGHNQADIDDEHQKHMHMDQRDNEQTLDDDSYDHHHHHHSHHGPAVSEQLMNAAKQGRTWAFWLRDNLKPLVAFLKAILTPVHRSMIPKEWKDVIGIRELIFASVVLSTLIFSLIQSLSGFLHGDAERKKAMVTLCQYAELYQRYKVLETELQKSNVSSTALEKRDAELKRLQDLLDSKIRECNEANQEIERLLNKLREAQSDFKIKQEAQNEEDNRQLDIWRQKHQILDAQLIDCKSGLEHEREHRERVEQERDSLRDELAQLDERMERRCAQDAETIRVLRDRCGELERRAKELDGLKAILSRQQTAAQTQLVDQKNDKGGSDSSGGWEWAEDQSESSDAENNHRDSKSREPERFAADFSHLAHLGLELKEKSDEIDRFKVLLKDLMAEKQELEALKEKFQSENEQLTGSLRDANEKSFTLESKIKALKDIYEDQLKDLTKQLTKQQMDREKQNSTVANIEDEANKLREESALLRKTDGELRSEIKELDNLLNKARLELDRCRHEAWTQMRRMEREKTAARSENALLRARLIASVRSDDEKSPCSPPLIAKGIVGVDDGNNSSEAELAGLARIASPRLAFPPMPAHPPPPMPTTRPLSLAGSSSFYDGPAAFWDEPTRRSPRDFYALRRPDDIYDDFELDNEGNMASLSRVLSPRIGGSFRHRRPKSKARTNPSRSRSPSPLSHRRATVRDVKRRDQDGELSRETRRSPRDVSDVAYDDAERNTYAQARRSVRDGDDDELEEDEERRERLSHDAKGSRKERKRDNVRDASPPPQSNRRRGTGSKTGGKN